MSGQGILRGVRVLDFTWVLAGPYATRILADFGAEVIKVQPLLPSDDSEFARGYYNTWNRNKLGITLNLSHPEGIGLARRLAGISDMVVENFTPRVMANWGLDYANLKLIKPDIIMVSLSLMGQDGPRRDYSGFGPTIHAFSSMSHLTTLPGRPPMGPGFAYGDHVAGLVAALGALGALEHRRRTGEGQYVDISEVEAMVSLLGGAVLERAATGREPEPQGNASPDAAPHGVYPCRGEDRWCAVAIFTEAQWDGLRRALRQPKWAGDARFANLSGRLAHREELDHLLMAWTISRTAEEVMSLLQAEGVPAGVVQNARDLAHDPQLEARGFFVRLSHPETGGETISDASPIRLSRDPARYERTAPAPGQDNDYVYGRLLGLSRDEMDSLRHRGVI